MVMTFVSVMLRCRSLSLSNLSPLKGPIHARTDLRRLQSLGKCHNENMPKAAFLAVILAYATEEETVCRKR